MCLAVVSALLLSGCKKSPEKELVVQKDMDNMIIEATDEDNGVVDVAEVVPEGERYTEELGSDELKVNVKVVEGNRERIQAFEGIVIARQNSGINETFTVRKIAYGVGVERCFPIHSPRIDRIEVLRKGRVRKAKLYYLRDRVGKAARLKERKS